MPWVLRLWGESAEPADPLSSVGRGSLVALVLVLVLVLPAAVLPAAGAASLDPWSSVFSG
jgi:hypothetical protein